MTTDHPTTDEWVAILTRNPGDVRFLADPLLHDLAGCLAARDYARREGISPHASAALIAAAAVATLHHEARQRRLMHPPARVRVDPWLVDALAALGVEIDPERIEAAVVRLVDRPPERRGAKPKSACQNSTPDCVT